jgi:PIN domain nuclease of toxin-antitoxin system
MPSTSSPEYFHARLSDEGRAILQALAKYHGVTLTSAFEMNLRDTARRMGDDDDFNKLVREERRQLGLAPKK